MQFAFFALCLVQFAFFCIVFDAISIVSLNFALFSLGYPHI